MKSGTSPEGTCPKGIFDCCKGKNILSFCGTSLWGRTSLWGSFWILFVFFYCNVQASVLIKSDSKTAVKPVTIFDGEKTERVTGSLWDGWKDNSGWAEVWIDYQFMKVEHPPGEKGPAGVKHKKFQRINVTKVVKGRCQFVWYDLPDLSKDQFLTLKFIARSPDEMVVKFGIRLNKSPYKFIWKSNETIGKDWKEYNYRFQLSKDAREVGFFFVLGEEGVLDIEMFELVKMSRKELIADLQAEYPEGEPANLFRLSRFPLGLQNGWSIDRNISDVEIVSDNAFVGPSGSPSLRIKSVRSTYIYTAPFSIPLAFKKHIASFYVRGTGILKTIVKADDRWLTTKEHNFGHTAEGAMDWRRIEIPFTPNLAKTYCIIFDITGTFWFDALQVEEGDKAKPYTSQLPCEVALSVDSPIRVVFEGKPAIVKYCVTGKRPRGSKLKVKVVNLYKEEKMLPDIKLDNKYLTEGKFRFDVFPDKPLGAFRIEVWVENTKGKRISTFNELVVNRLKKPRYWMKDAPDSPFGVHTNPTTRHILMAKAMGFNWSRLHDAGHEFIGWYWLERKPGLWTFYDEEILRYRKYGLKILGGLSTVPEWASYFEKSHHYYFDRFYQPKKLSDFGNYVRKVVKRYKGVIDTYEVWNEPYIHSFWPVSYDERLAAKGSPYGYKPSADSWGDYVRLMKTAYKNAKSVYPEVTILGFCTTTSKKGDQRRFSGEEWTRNVVANNGIKYCDVISYHQYTEEYAGFPGDEIEEGFKTAVGPIIVEHPSGEKFETLPKPVWLSEGSPIPSGSSTGFYNHTLTYKDTEDVVAVSDQVCRFVVSLLSQGVQKVFFYSMHCHVPFVDNPYNFLTDEGYIHPLGCAHSVMAWLLEDTKFIKTVKVRENVYGFLFQGKNRAVAVLSRKRGQGKYLLPKDGKVKAIDLYGNPVIAGSKLGKYLVYLDGKVKVSYLENLLKK